MVQPTRVFIDEDTFEYSKNDEKKRLSQGVLILFNDILLLAQEKRGNWEIGKKLFLQKLIPLMENFCSCRDSTPEQEDSTTFEIQDSTNAVLILKAKTPADRKKWVAMINKAVADNSDLAVNFLVNKAVGVSSPSVPPKETAIATPGTYSSA